MSRVLVAEDDADIADLVRHYLQKAGFEADVVGSGRDVLPHVRRSAPDLIILDVMLPGLDGLEVCRAIRADVNTAGIPIIMLTAKGEESDRIVGLELGADDYITKPFSPMELRARVKAVLRRSQREDEVRAYRFGDVEVDFTRHEVRRSGRSVDLTSLEFKLLGAFCRNRGRALTREQVLDLAWGHGVAVSERVVDNHVVRLRKAIEPDPATPRYLVSVRGVGYRFDG